MAPVKDWNNAKKHEMRELAIPSRKVRRYLCCPASTCLEIRLLLDKKLLYKDSFIHAIEKDATQHNAIRANLNAWGLKSKYIIEGELTRIRLKGFVDKPFDGAWLDLCNPLTPDIMRWTSRELAAGVLAPGMEFSVTFCRVRPEANFYRCIDQLWETKHFQPLHQLVSDTPSARIACAYMGCFWQFAPVLLDIQPYRMTGDNQSMPMMFFKMVLLRGVNPFQEFSSAVLHCYKTDDLCEQQKLIRATYPSSPQERAWQTMRARKLATTI